jgi:hypothetical protein
MSMENVSIKVKAIAPGYYRGRIIEVEEVFQYEGGLNAKGKLPLWVEAMEKLAEPKKAKVEKKVEKAPLLPELKEIV